MAMPKTQQTRCFKLCSKEKLTVADISTSTKCRVVRICKAGCLPEQNSDELEESDDKSDEKSDVEDCVTEDESPNPPYSKNAVPKLYQLGSGFLLSTMISISQEK